MAVKSPSVQSCDILKQILIKDNTMIDGNELMNFNKQRNRKNVILSCPLLYTILTIKKGGGHYEYIYSISCIYNRFIDDNKGWRCIFKWCYWNG